MLLAAFLVQAHPAAAALYEVVADLHLQHSAHAGKGVDHRADQRPVAQTDERRLLGFGSVLALRLSDGLDAVEQLSGLLGRPHRRFSLLDDGTVKSSGILGFWRRNRSSVERRINNLGTCQGAD